MNSVPSNVALKSRHQKGLQEAKADSASLAGLVERANRHHQKVIRGLSYALVHAKKAGYALRKAKKLAGRGNWTSWLKENFSHVSPESVRVYMRISRQWHLIAKIVVDNPTLSIEGARYILRRPTKKRPLSDADADQERKDLRLWFTGMVNGLTADKARALHNKWDDLSGNILRMTEDTPTQQTS